MLAIHSLGLKNVFLLTVLLTVVKSHLQIFKIFPYQLRFNKYSLAFHTFKKIFLVLGLDYQVFLALLSLLILLIPSLFLQMLAGH